MYCENPNLVISVAYKIQFRSKANESLLELDISSSVAFKNCKFYLHNYNKIPREISWIFFFYSPLVVGVLIHFILYFYFVFSSIFNFSFCGFKISFSFSWVASLGIRDILPPVINNFNIIGYTEGWSQCLDSISLKL